MQSKNGADLTLSPSPLPCDGSVLRGFFLTLTQAARLPATSNSAAQLLLGNYFQLELNMQGEKTKTSCRLW
jgi:hypothetical protein